MRRTTLITLIVVGSMMGSTCAETVALDALLEQVRQGNRDDQAMNLQRMQRFERNRVQQAQLLAELELEIAAAETDSQNKERQFADNEQQTLMLQQQLNERLGALKELFGVLQISATDAQAAFESSLVQMHYPERTEVLAAFANKMEQTVELPRIQEIEQLWFEMHREITESGKTVNSTQTVLTAEGSEVQQTVTRVGTFNLISDGAYLQRVIETGQLVEPPQQPAARYMTGAQALTDSESALMPLTIDPIRGQLLSLLGSAPKLSDRVHQGGAIGYIILGLGVMVLLVALGRLVVLAIDEHRISQQMKHPEQPGNNPLGRVFKTYQDYRNTDLETLELKLSDAVLQEVPRINRWVSFIKISAAIAPLLGLLGTVTGMIITFQAITLFGAGDPKLMAGGISQALVTTVLGLTVAIPSLLLHNLVQGKAAKLTEILEQESVAMVAEYAELSSKEDTNYASAA